VVTAFLAFTPAVPRVGAVDPTPDPSAAAPTPDPTPTPTPDPTPTPAVDPTPAPTPDPTPTPAVDPTPAPTPDPTPTPAVDPTPAPTPDPSPTPAVDPTPAPTPDPSPTPSTPVRATLVISSSAPSAGRHRVDPGSTVTLHLSGRIETAARDARLVASYPTGWTVVEANGATVDPEGLTVTWARGDLGAGAALEADLLLRAPAIAAMSGPVVDSTVAARVEHAGGVAATAETAIRVAPDLVIEHVTFARLDRATHAPSYLPADQPLANIAGFDEFRVRFQVRNPDLLDAPFIPALQFAETATDRFEDVPIAESRDGLAFYLDGEWRAAPGGHGTVPGPPEEAIPVAGLLVGDTGDPSQVPVPGRRLMGEGSSRIVLKGDAFTEIEFSVSVSRDLASGESYELRLTDAGQAILGASTAKITASSAVATPLSPGQRNGIAVGRPKDAKPVADSGVDLPPVTGAAVAGTWPEASGEPRYRLVIALPSDGVPAAAYGAPGTSPHTPDPSLTSDTCAICHRAHVAQNASLLAEGAPQATMCFTCHDGAGSSLNVKSQYSDSAVPPNDASTRSYFRHDATTPPVPPNVHVLSSTNEFEGVANRHSECADCHNSHNATTASPSQLASGWTIPGQVAAVSGVTVVNGAPGSAPTYAFKDGSAGSQPDREYQLCLKCHSGFTTLPSNTGRPQSQYVLDKGVELNPATTSFHPVEAAGTNRTPQMTWSLSNTSPFKQWNFAVDGTVRCVHCHGDPRKYSATTPPAPQGDLAAHTSQYRGLLIQNYRDRLLKPASEAYAAADFALCYVCHAEGGMVASTAENTGFIEHSKHLTDLFNMGPGGSSIDTPYAGGGNALCSECHFRVHGTALAVNPGDRSNPRLVNFAPNVGPNGSTLEFTKTATGGTCTLVCHGEAHFNASY
jgi:predicted CXXCH cytochrome family protein